jgi:ribosomal protein S17
MGNRELTESDLAVMEELWLEANKKTVSVVMFSTFKHSKYQKSMSKEFDLDSDVICMCEFEEGEQITILPCKHLYHTECIEQNFKERNTCPICHAEY